MGFPSRPPARPPASASQEDNNKIIGHRGRSDQQPNGDTHGRGNDHGGTQQTADALEQGESAPINSAAAAAAFKMAGSTYTGGGTGLL